LVAVLVPLALALGLGVGALGPFTGVAVLGAVVIVVLGYGYVALTILLRHLFGPRFDEAQRAVQHAAAADERRAYRDRVSIECAARG
jgi:hypothetical protein